MAAVFEALPASRSPPFRRSPLPTAAALAPTSFSAAPGRRRGTDVFLEIRGLRIGARSPMIASVSISRRPRAVRGGIVCEAKNAVIEVPDVTQSTWKSLVMEGDLVLVEFWTPWCGPCRMIHPTVGELSKEYEGKLKCFKLNTDESPDIATQYGIRSIPTIMIFKNGEKKDAVIGAVPKATLTDRKVLRMISKDGELHKDKKLLSSVSKDFMVSESMLEYLVESLGFSSYEKPIWVLKQTKQLLMNCVREGVENQQERQGRCCDEEIIYEENQPHTQRAVFSGGGRLVRATKDPPNTDP
ncbi:hypothetical protein QJS10_CPA09g01609 [Acorus calamus]|uniref:Thioredoxin domain-containing protein n=1 Tax=Acorus calamus TaxID=4465 RepID=A0AAV9EB90_ACOCL|nr:hypothetical protein QJS10_CPA09g01609 [Acorus calamus]